MRTTATTTGAAKKAKLTRPLGVYVASASDPTAVFEYPDHDWVYLTPEPIHPVAQEHWPYPCRGWRWYVRGGQALFLDVLHAKLGRDDWTLQEHLAPNHALYTHKADGRTLNLFYNQTVEEHSAEAAAVMKPASIITWMGWGPGEEMVAKIRALAPKAERVHWEEEGDYVPVLDEGVKWAPEIGDEWKFVAHEWPTDDEEGTNTDSAHEWPTDDEESAHTDSEQDEE